MKRTKDEVIAQLRAFIAQTEQDIEQIKAAEEAAPGDMYHYHRRSEEEARKYAYTLALELVQSLD